MADLAITGIDAASQPCADGAAEESPPVSGAVLDTVTGVEHLAQTAQLIGRARTARVGAVMPTVPAQVGALLSLGYDWQEDR